MITFARIASTFLSLPVLICSGANTAAPAWEGIFGNLKTIAI